jgi:hypothetical protein
MSTAVTVSQHFGITGNVPFVDVNVHGDTLLFMDPHAIRLHARNNDRFADSAVSHLDSFFGVITDSILHGSAADKQRARHLLCRFHEPWQTRLGMSSAGFAGRGGADDAGQAIWNALSTEIRPLLQIGIGRRIEELPLFVEGIGADKTSDLTTRIIIHPLMEFTREMMKQYPALAASTSTAEIQTWSVEKSDWEESLVELPAINSKQLLLVPTLWVNKNLLFTADRYHGIAALGFEQDNRTVWLQGKAVRPTKEDLAKLPSLRPGHATNRAITLSAARDKKDLIRRYQAHIDPWYLNRIQLPTSNTPATTG